MPRLAETDIELWYNFETHEFQTTPVMLNFEAPPEDMTQEEWRLVKMMATQMRDWWSSRRTANNLADLSNTSATKMKAAYDSLQLVYNTACLFAPKKRIKTLYTYATKHHRAALYYAKENKV